MKRYTLNLRGGPRLIEVVRTGRQRAVWDPLTASDGIGGAGASAAAPDPDDDAAPALGIRGAAAFALPRLGLQPPRWYHP